MSCVLGCCDPFEEFFCLRSRKEVRESCEDILYIAILSILLAATAYSSLRTIQGKPLNINKPVEFPKMTLAVSSIVLAGLWGGLLGTAVYERFRD